MRNTINYKKKVVYLTILQIQYDFITMSSNTFFNSLLSHSSLCANTHSQNSYQKASKNMSLCARESCSTSAYACLQPQRSLVPRASRKNRRDEADTTATATRNTVCRYIQHARQGYDTQGRGRDLGAWGGGMETPPHSSLAHAHAPTIQSLSLSNACHGGFTVFKSAGASES